jgi:hypothetical protein
MIDENFHYLRDQTLRCVSDAFQQLSPSTLSSGVGIARFAVNRRNNQESDVLYSSDLTGPTDHTVPVIKVSDTDGNLKAILFGYACHATTLSNHEWSGDYPGFAQQHLEASLPGVTALFFAGCGGDQNALPRGTVPLAEQYGGELAEAVKRVLEEPMKELKSKLASHYQEIELSFSDPLSVNELQEIVDSAPPWQQRWATTLINKMEQGEKLPGTYPFYPVQSWKLGDQLLIALGGEVVVDYAIKLRKTWGDELFITAYANDVMAYIPSERVLKEGGYEGNTSMRAYGQPSTWSPGLEEKILTEVGRQINQIKRAGL